MKKGLARKIIKRVTAEKQVELPHLYAIGLKAGNWRAFFSEDRFKLIIARSLNETVDKREYKKTLVGYLITDKWLCLVLHTTIEKLHSFLMHFNAEVKNTIQRLFERTDKTVFTERIRHLNLQMEDLTQRLFSRRPMNGYMLVNLLIGREVELQYYSPHLTRMQDKLRNYKYSSVYDYAGAKKSVHNAHCIKSMVRVHLLKSSECDEPVILIFK
jgi:hypothetical protein